MPSSSPEHEANLTSDVGNGRAPGENSGSWNGGKLVGACAVPQRIYVTGMTVALGGILMFFMALVSSFIVRKGMPNSGWRPLDAPRILWFNTIIVAASSFAIARARKHVRADQYKKFRRWWMAGSVLGVVFLVGQGIAWQQLMAKDILLWTNPSSSFFYVFTATHGLHLICGIIVLLVIAFRLPRRLVLDTATEVVSMYWHFMVGLWVFLFLLLLLGQ
jgi:cytochrome c oxidase subunit 3